MANFLMPDVFAIPAQFSRVNVFNLKIIDYKLWIHDNIVQKNKKIVNDFLVYFKYNGIGNFITQGVCSMNFFTTAKIKRPVRLKASTRRWAWESMQGKYGTDAMQHPFLSVFNEDFEEWDAYK